MDKSELRRLQLKALTDALGWGGIATVAKQIGKEPSYVSRMLYEPTKAGKKRITETSADLIEAAFPGWMDDASAAAKGIRPPTRLATPAGKVDPDHRTERNMMNDNDFAAEHIVSALQDWRLQASSKSQEVIDQLTLLAKKNKLRDEDWLLIEQMVQRFVQK